MADAATNTLIESAKCDKCIPPGTQLEVIIALLQDIAGTTYTAKELMDNAKCYKCIPAGTQPEVINYLLNYIVENGS